MFMSNISNGKEDWKHHYAILFMICWKISLQHDLKIGLYFSISFSFFHTDIVTITSISNDSQQRDRIIVIAIQYACLHSIEIIKYIKYSGISSALLDTCACLSVPWPLAISKCSKLLIIPNLPNLHSWILHVYILLWPVNHLTPVQLCIQSKL